MRTSVLRERDFRLLWSGQTASMLGDALVVVAIGLFVTRLTGRATDVGLVLASYTLPVVLLVLVGGVVADRVARQRLMVLADGVRCVLHAALALLIVTGAVRVWHMCLIGVLFGSAEAFFRPAYSGLVPQTVREDQIQDAQALSGVSRELASFVGPAVATALVLTVGGAAAFALDALTFVASAVLLLRVRARPRGPATPRTGMLRELRHGWDEVRTRAWVWVTICGFSVALLLALAPYFVLGPTVARDVYGTSAVYGVGEAAWGVGTVSGAVAGSRWRPRRPMLAAGLVSAPWPLCCGALALGLPRALLYALLAAGGAGIGLFAVWWETALAQRIPPALLSRVSAWDWMGSTALLPLGLLAAGPLAAVVGPRQVLLGGGALGTVAMLLVLAPPSSRAIVRLPAPARPGGPPRVGAAT